MCQNRDTTQALKLLNQKHLIMLDKNHQLCQSNHMWSSLKLPPGSWAMNPTPLSWAPYGPEVTAPLTLSPAGTKTGHQRSSCDLLPQATPFCASKPPTHPNKMNNTDRWLSAPNEPLCSNSIITQPLPRDIFNCFLAVACCSQPFLSDIFSGPLQQLESQLTVLWDSQAHWDCLFYAEK